MRLVGGSRDLEGRVEFCANGVWGTVCDDNWGVSDARVVCRQLGYSAASMLGFSEVMKFSHEACSLAYSLARFGQGSGPIQLDEVRCDGTEAMLGACPANPVGVNDCSHFEDAGVGCQGTSGLSRHICLVLFHFYCHFFILVHVRLIHFFDT